jgi:hypothetical protein
MPVPTDLDRSRLDALVDVVAAARRVAGGAVGPAESAEAEYDAALTALSEALLHRIAAITADHQARGAAPLDAVDRISAMLLLDDLRRLAELWRVDTRIAARRLAAAADDLRTAREFGFAIDDTP